MECIIEDISIHYEEFGSGKPVLCLHGFPQDHRTMIGCMEPCFKDLKGYRRIYIDLPGMGKSTSKPWIKNADIMLDILIKFIEKIIPEESFLLAGLSYGGYMTLGLLLQTNFNIDGVFLICPCLVSDRKKRTKAYGEPLIEDGLASSIDNKEDFKGFLDYAVMATSKTWTRYKK